MINGGHHCTPRPIMRAWRHRPAPLLLASIKTGNPRQAPTLRSALLTPHFFLIIITSKKSHKKSRQTWRRCSSHPYRAVLFSNRWHSKFERRALIILCFSNFMQNQYHTHHFNIDVIKCNQPICPLHISLCTY